MTPRVAIVHERFTEFAGSEQVVEQLAGVWPEASIHAPIVDAAVVPAALRPRVHGTALSRGLRTGGGYAHLLPALPFAMAHLAVGRPDVVVASHHAFASQVVRATTSPVVAYVHSPARWVWDPAMRRDEIGGPLGRAGLAAFATAFRPADRAAAGRLESVLANSREVAARIARWWDREAQVIHPPVDTDFYRPDPSIAREDFLLLAGRLVPYKRPALAVRAAARAGRRLVVAGDGRSRAECEAAAGPGATFLGRVSNEELRGLFQRAAAVLMPGVEDFGIVPVEAQACGAPVVATAAGGALDSVLPGVTGELVDVAGALDERSGSFDESELEARWVDALRDFDPARYDTGTIRRHAESFSRDQFRERMGAHVERVVGGSMARAEW